MSNRKHTNKGAAQSAGSGSRLVELRGHEQRMHALRARRIDLEVERIVAGTQLRSAPAGAAEEIPGAAASAVIRALDRLRSLESRRAAVRASADTGVVSREDLLERLRAGDDALGAWLDADRKPADTRAVRAAKTGLLLACLGFLALAVAVHFAFLVLLVPVGGAMSFLLWTGHDRSWRRMGARRRFESLRIELPVAWTEDSVRPHRRTLSLAADGLRQRRTDLGSGDGDEDEDEASMTTEIEVACSDLEAALVAVGIARDSIDEPMESRLRAHARAWRADQALQGITDDLAGVRAGADAIRESIYRDLARAGAPPPGGNASVGALESGVDRIRRR